MTKEQQESVKIQMHIKHLGGILPISLNYIKDEYFIDVKNENASILIKIIPCGTDENLEDIIKSNRASTKARATELGYKSSAIYAIKFDGTNVVDERFDDENIILKIK